MAFGDASTLQTMVISTPSGAPTNIFGTCINGWTETIDKFKYSKYYPPFVKGINGTKM